MFSSRLWLLAGMVLGAGCALDAQEEGGTVPGPEKNWQFSATWDGYGLVNFAHPATGRNALRNFDIVSDSFRSSAATAGFEYKAGRFGIHFDGGYGDLYKTIAATDSWKGANQYVMQGYVSYRPLAGNALQLDFGKFYSSAGAEVPDTLANFNYSRSFAFTLGMPCYHFGLRASVPVSKTLTVGVQVINGINDTTGQNGGKMLGFTSAFTHKKWGWNQVWITGPEKPAGQRVYRNLVDEVLVFSPVASVQGYAEAFYGKAAKTGQPGERWYGAAAAVRWSATSKLSFSPRVEVFADPAGFTSGTAQRLREVTATAEYKLNRFVTSRFEFRRDDSSQAVFDTGNGGLKRSQETLLVGLLMAWKGER